MKKKLYLLTLISGLTMAMAACGNTVDNIGNASDTDKEEKSDNSNGGEDESNSDSSEQDVKSSRIEKVTPTDEIMFDGTVKAWASDAGQVTIYKPEEFEFENYSDDSMTTVTLSAGNSSYIYIVGANTIITDYDGGAMSTQVLSTKTVTNKDGTQITVCEAKFVEDGNGEYTTCSYFLPLSAGYYLQFWYYTDANFNDELHNEEIKGSIPDISEEAMLELTSSDFVVIK